VVGVEEFLEIPIQNVRKLVAAEKPQASVVAGEQDPGARDPEQTRRLLLQQAAEMGGFGRVRRVRGSSQRSPSAISRCLFRSACHCVTTHDNNDVQGQIRRSQLIPKLRQFGYRIKVEQAGVR
jgi:hypothetical protein